MVKSIRRSPARSSRQAPSRVIRGGVTYTYNASNHTYVDTTNPANILSYLYVMDTISDAGSVNSGTASGCSPSSSYDSGFSSSNSNYDSGSSSSYDSGSSSGSSDSGGSSGGGSCD